MILDFGWIDGFDPDVVCVGQFQEKPSPVQKAIGENITLPDNFKVILLELC